MNVIRSPVFIAGIASPNLDDFTFFPLLQIHESRCVYVVSEPIPAQNQTQGRQSGGAEAEKAGQPWVLDKGQNASTGHFSLGYKSRDNWRFSNTRLLIASLWKQLDFLPLCLFWASSKRLVVLYLQARRSPGPSLDVWSRSAATRAWELTRVERL